MENYSGAANQLLNQSIVKNYKFCKEYIDEYKDRKREIHYLQHDIDLKRTEIERLNRLMEAEKNQIDKDQITLRDDAVKFNEFLKQSDKVCIEAIKRAELESKLKNEKLNEFKQLTTQYQVLKNEIAKKTDVMRELEEYERFFTSIGDKNWTSEALIDYVSSLEQENLELLMKYQQIQQKTVKSDCCKDIVVNSNETTVDIEHVFKNKVVYKKTNTNTTELDAYVEKLYKSCIGNELNLNTFQMLGEIETKVNDIMEKYDKLPGNEQLKIRKALDKKMREHEHVELIELQKLKIDEKSKRQHLKKKVKVTLKKKNELKNEEKVDVDQDFFWK